MRTPLLLAILVAPLASDDLFHLVAELRALDHHDGEGHYDQVDEQRLVALEQRLGAMLELPPELGLSLELPGGSRVPQGYALQHDRLSARLVHGPDEDRLCSVFLSLDGERATLEDLRFVQLDGASRRTRMQLRSEDYLPRARQGAFFRNLVAELGTSAELPVELHSIGPSGGLNFHARYAYVNYRYFVGDGDVRHELQVCAKVSVFDGEPAQGARPEAEVPGWRLYGGGEPGPADAWRSLRTALERGVALIRRCEAVGPRRIQLRGGSPCSDDYTLRLELSHGDATPATLTAGVWRDGEDRWRVMEDSAQLPELAVDLDVYLALVDRAARLAADDGASIGAFGVAFEASTGSSLALVVTCAEDSLWDAAAASLRVLRVDAQGALQVVDQVQLDEIQVQRGLRPGFKGTSTQGHSLEYSIQLAGDSFEVDPARLRYRDLSAPLMGGSGARPARRRP